MNNLQTSPEAKSDLQSIREYITVKLENPIAAENTVRKIVESIGSLSTLSERGAPLSNIVSFETNYRYLVCGNYLIFYYVERKDVFVSRVLYGRSDYIRTLFGDLPDSP